MATIKYPRGTTYILTHTWMGPALGSKLLFTVKTVENDSDTTDAATNAVMPPKDITMTGSTMPQTTVVKILPTDVADTVDPDDYFFDGKVLDVNGDIWPAFAGKFELTATPTNRFS